ncbi:aldo/keto reductase [Agrococcus sp. ARC_14]|uniref:aldo/keto reductase n=1 Tax=Agrococcus sp. ARC_14 TaxID=2919927 RepID=UPI001F066886|nr:aldo/keto reductase [Agrococcus sp. ARC_14]MCH1883861.1 aldo/keto reductase [Agrococcus sp. ARC_14]
MTNESTTIPTLELNDGRTIPQLGFGVFKVDPAETERIVTDALEAGYRHIDTAAIYGNEEGVGRALAASGIARDELFVTTKLWNDRRGAADTRAALGESLEKLGLSHVDLYLIHWPTPQTVSPVETWETLATLRDEGLTTSIGVSNFDERYLPAILETGVIPAINQIELHPQFQQRAATALAAEHAIAIEAWGPLGQGKVDYAATVIGEIAERIGASWAQVTIAWHLASGRIVFPKSNRRERMDENLAAAGVQLSAADVAAIDALDQGAAGRVASDPAEVN